MSKRVIVGIMMLAFVNLMFAGCTKMVKLQLDEARNIENTKIAEVVTKQGIEWKFGRKGGQVDFTSETVTGTSRGGAPVEIAFADVDCLKAKKTDPIMSALLLVGVVGLTVGIVRLIEIKKWTDDPLGQ